MKKIQKLSILLIIFLLIISNVVLATSDTEKTNLNVTAENEVLGEEGIMPISLDISEDEKLKENNLNEIQKGDVYLAKEIVSLENPIDGNLYVVASNIDISNDVIYGNVFVVAENVTINANITGATYIVAKNVTINAGMTDAYIVAENIEFKSDAYVERDARMVGESLILDGEISGSLYTSVKEIVLKENGYVAGTLSYSGELNYKDGAQIGNLAKYEINVDTEKIQKQSQNHLKALNIVTKTITALIIIGVIVRISNNGKEKETVIGVIKGIIAGFSWMFVIPILIIFGMITIIGLPISMLALFVYILMYFIVIPMATLQIAKILLQINNKDTKFMIWLTGTLIYLVVALIQNIPTVGAIVTFILGTYGFNLILKKVFKKSKKVSKEDVIMTEDSSK